MIPKFSPPIGFREFIRIFLPASKNAVSIFEKNFAKKMKQKYAIAFPHGRTGLIFLLKQLGLEGKEVICPSYTCVVVPHAIVYSNNTPVFVDSVKEDFNMDFDLIEEAVNDNTGAIIATSIYGNPVNLYRIEKIRRKYPHIKIIQDCAHGFGSEYEGTRVNTVGDAAIFGLNISKVMTSVFGGMVTTDSEDTYRKLKEMQYSDLNDVGIIKSLKRRLYFLSIYVAFNRFVYGFVFLLTRYGFLDRFVKYFDESKIDMPSDYLDKMTHFEANIGIVQTDRYDDNIKSRKKIGKKIDEMRGVLSDDGKTYSHYPVLVDKRDIVLEKVLKEGIELGKIIDYSCDKMIVYNKNKYFSNNDFSKSTSGQVINIPICKIPSDKINRVIKIIKKYEVK